MKVPDISQPTESRTADPHIDENEVEKAVGVRPYGHFIDLPELLFRDPGACQLIFHGEIFGCRKPMDRQDICIFLQAALRPLYS